jgi:hypothetical protein
MASRVQKRRGNNSDHLAFNSGAAGEITIEIPDTRNFGATDGTRNYGAIWIHHGDTNIGDRIPSSGELNETIRGIVDEQKFLAKITHFKPVNYDYNSSIAPNSRPNKYLYAWEEVSIGSTHYDTASVQQLEFTGNTGTASSGSITHRIRVPNSSKQLQNVDVVIGDSQTPAQAVATIKTALEATDDAVDNTIKLAGTNGVYTASIASNTLSLTANANFKGERPLMIVHTNTAGGDTTQSVATDFPKISTEGTSLVPTINIANADLARKSDPSTNNDHTLYAFNTAELMNDVDFVFPGLRTSPLQSSNGDYPTNHKVLPIGGVPNYGAGSADLQAENEPEVGTGASDTAMTYETADGVGSSTATAFDSWKPVSRHVVVEMTERRKVIVGTDASSTHGFTSNGVGVMYYFSVPNIIVGPC